MYLEVDLWDQNSGVQHIFFENVAICTVHFEMEPISDQPNI